MNYKPKGQAENDAQRMLMTAHTLFYGIGWAVAFLTVISPYTSHTWIAFFMVWTVLYIGHLVFYNRQMSTVSAPADERQIYRDAYHDAMQQLKAEQNRFYREDFGSLTEEDGELSDYEAEKLKRR